MMSWTIVELPGMTGFTTPVPDDPARQSSPLDRLSMSAAGIEPGFEAPLPEATSPSISKPWTVPAWRPVAARAEDGFASSPYCIRIERTKMTSQDRVIPRRRRSLNDPMMPRDPMMLTLSPVSSGVVAACALPMTPQPDGADECRRNVPPRGRQRYCPEANPTASEWPGSHRTRPRLRCPNAPPGIGSIRSREQRRRYGVSASRPRLAHQPRTAIAGHE